MPRARRGITRETVTELEPVTVPRFTLGWELEATAHATETPRGIILERDGSVAGVGAEYKIAPEFVDNPSENLELLRQLTADSELHVDRSCGFHVHVGIGERQGVTEHQRKQWAGMMVALARAVETSAFSAVPESRRQNNFCRPWAGNSQAVTQHRYSSTKYGNSPMRYHWVNVVEMFRPGGIRTVEIRLLGSTKRYAYLLGWIGACHLMARAAWRLVQDPSALIQETTALQAKFQKIKAELLANRPNERAYSVAVGLIQESQIIPNALDTFDRLVDLANRADEVRISARRVMDVNRAYEMAITMERESVYVDDAHDLGLNEEAERCHAEALRMNRPVRARRVTPRQRMQTVLQEAYNNAPIQGFNPEAFVIVPTGGN